MRLKASSIITDVLRELFKKRYEFLCKDKCGFYLTGHKWATGPDTFLVIKTILSHTIWVKGAEKSRECWRIPLPCVCLVSWYVSVQIPPQSSHLQTRNRRGNPDRHEFIEQVWVIELWLCTHVPLRLDMGKMNFFISSDTHKWGFPLPSTVWNHNQSWWVQRLSSAPNWLNKICLVRQFAWISIVIFFDYSCLNWKSGKITKLLCYLIWSKKKHIVLENQEFLW